MSKRNLAALPSVQTILRFLILFFILASALFAVEVPSKSTQKKRVKSLLAYVYDDRFSVVRARPEVEGPFLRRLRVGHRVFLVAGVVPPREGKFRRVVISRNLSGWILAAAIVAPGIPGDDEKLFQYAASQPREKALMVLRILMTHFERSPRRATALLRLGQLAEEEAEQLSVRANRALAHEKGSLPRGLDDRDFYANYRGLDRWASNGIRFIYKQERDRYVYQGDAYREIVKKYSGGPEAASARERLAGIDDALKE
jgi:hypothetical protein